MAQPIEFEPAPRSTPIFAAYDSPSVADAELECGDIYQEIAERRAQLECAETLRRVRAL